VIVAFATFNATDLGSLVASSFQYITPKHIKALQAAGLKVLISIGGADATEPGTTVNFHQISGGANFTQKFTKGIEKLVSTYGFDGIDIDLEQGFTSDGSPSDVDNMAAVIKALRKDNPDLLISLVPQAENVAPQQTQGKFINIYSSYSNLALQTYKEITWSGVQIYNTGGMNGINGQLYSNMDPKNVNFSVAMGVDMLADWPSKLPDGRDTGFPPYKAVLRDDQVLLGYPAPDSRGASDGGPPKDNSVIKRIIGCLKGGFSQPSLCDGYTPPKNYPNLGGVFEWELTYDQDNSFRFASELNDCVKSGKC
jgi:chitinase